MVEEKIIINFREQGINQIISQQKRLQNQITNLNTEGQRFAKQQKAVNKLMTGGAQKLVDNATKINRLGKQHEGFFRVMGMSQENFKKFNQEGGEFTKRSSKFANKIRLATHGLRGFRMEMLGVMFFGLALNKFFMGLLQPVLKATGLFELFSAILEVIFLPIIEVLLPHILRFADWLLNLSKKSKMIIGILTILGVVLGLGLQLFGMFALGIGSLILAFTGLFNTASNFLALLLPGEFGEMVAGIALLIPGIEGLGWVFEKLGKVWDFIKEKWDFLKEELDINIDAIKDKVTGFIKEFKADLKANGIDLDTWKEELGKAFGEEGVLGMWGKITKFWDEKLQPMWKDFSSLVDKLTENLPGLTTALEGVLAVMKPIVEAWNEMPNFLKGAIVGGLVGGPLGAAAGAGIGLASDVNKIRPAIGPAFPGSSLVGITNPTPSGTIDININFTGIPTATVDFDIEGLTKGETTVNGVNSIVRRV